MGPETRWVVMHMDFDPLVTNRDTIMPNGLQIEPAPAGLKEDANQQIRDDVPSNVCLAKKALACHVSGRRL
jgi:hypothetical protein